MSSRPITSSADGRSAHLESSTRGRPYLSDSTQQAHLESGVPDMAGTSAGFDHAEGGPQQPSALSESAHYDEIADPAHRPVSSSVDSSAAPELQRSDSRLSQAQSLPSRGGTLKKKASLRRTGSLMRTSSRRSSRAGSVRSVNLGEREKYGQSEEMNSVFYSPVPLSGNPTELLANRFQAWRKVLKDLIAYFRDVQKSYDTRAKTILSASNVIHNTTIPPQFLTSGGLGDAVHILQDFNDRAISEQNKAKDIENEIILQLTGLRSDLQQKIKEIKSLSGDFKSSVEKEKEGTKKAIRALQESLGSADHDVAASTGKGDPFIVKMGVDRQVERQIEEENYLHRAYLNLESSGRELESIVVGEIQKAYNAYAGILKREADDQFETVGRLREGPLAMAKDHEWDVFVSSSSQMVDPRIPLRSVERVTYPGKDHPAAVEVKSGMLERKSKYLKNYTPGWYILSPTHLHEYKSADRISSQSPIMSLYLPEQKLGTHSEPSSSSHKFMLKGRQTGSMHRGHTWIFRAETHETMMAWYAIIKELTERTGERRNEFVRRTHARSLSGNSFRAASIGGSSDGGMEEDEADYMPYASEQSVRGDSVAVGAGLGLSAGAMGSNIAYDHDDGLSGSRWVPPQRPSPGGRFPSDVNVHRGLQAPISPSSGESSEGDRAVIATARALPGSELPFASQHLDAIPIQPTPAKTTKDENLGTSVSDYPTKQAMHPNLGPGLAAFDGTQKHGGDGGHEGEWLATGGVSEAVVGAGATRLPRQQEPNVAVSTEEEKALDASTVPIPVAASSITDSPTHTHAMTTSSQDGTFTTLSTAPTSTDQAPTQSQIQNSFEPDKAWTAVNANVDLTTGRTVTPQMARVEAMVIRPTPVTTRSATTISDLHIPGEFPKVVATAE